MEDAEEGGGQGPRLAMRVKVETRRPACGPHADAGRMRVNAVRVDGWHNFKTRSGTRMRAAYRMRVTCCVVFICPSP